ncbi:Alpha/Beta hydrolase protein [Aspergillus carlsbadensis]|nr:Alpha/Beta hydrolase protein [Aspergillus carlsbadensis]
MQIPPATDEEFQERLAKAFPYYMHDTDKTHLLEEAMEGGTLSVWNFLNQSRCDAQEKFSAVDGLDKVRARTLVVNGRSDGICSEAAARKIAEDLGDKAELLLVEEAGHLPWIEQPGVFFPAVERFLLSSD